MEAQPVVHVVDDDDAVRDSLRFLLEAEGYVVRTYSGAQALIEADLPPAGCVITDFQMPGMDGLQLQATLAERGVRLAVVVMTAFGEIPLAVRAMRGGAIDFLEKPFENQSLLDAVQRALTQNKKALQAISRAASAARRISALTPREHEVLAAVAEGLTNRQVGRRLEMKERTVAVHVSNVLRKTNTRSRTQAAALLQRVRAR